MSEAVLEFRRLADDLPVLVWTHDASGAVQWSNRAWKAYGGRDADLEELLRVWRRRRDAPGETDVTIASATGERRWFALRFAPRHDRNDAPAGWVGSAFDIHDVRVAHAQLAFFAQLGEELAGTLELQETIDAVTRLVVPQFADSATVALGRGGRARVDPHAIAVPLRRGNRVRGMLEVRTDESGRSYGADDVRFFGELARRIAPALENAEAYERERNVAHTFQEAALQPSLPDVPGLVFDAIYEAGRSEALIGGDWFDAFRIPDGRIVVSVGDVAGSGLDAAVTMASVRQGIRMVSGVNPDPNVLLDAADRALRASDPERYVTAFVAVLDPVFGTLTWASAGHPPALLRRGDGELAALRGGEPPLGLRGRVHEVPETITLAPGDLLVLYTDGLTEATRDVIAGERALCEAVAALDRPGHAAEALHERVLGAREPSDDVAILTVGFQHALVDANEPRRAWRWRFDARDAVAARGVRREIVERLSGFGADGDARGTGELVFGELIGNVVRYAPGAVDVVLDLSGDAPVLHVADEGSGFEHNPKLPVDQLSERGRGLFIVAALTEELYVSRRLNGGSHARAVLYAPASTYFAEAVRGSGG